MQLFTHFAKAATDGAISAVSMLPLAAHPHSYAAANRAPKRTAWYSTFGAAATWSSIG